MSVAPAVRRWLLSPEAFEAVTAGMPPGAVPGGFRVEPSGGEASEAQDPPAPASGPQGAADAARVEAAVRAAVAIQAEPDAAVSLRARSGTLEVLAEVAVRGAAVSTLLRARRPGEDGGRVEVASAGAQRAVTEVTRALGLLGDLASRPGRAPVHVAAGAVLGVASVPGDDVPPQVADLVRRPAGTLQLWAYARGPRESAWAEVWLGGRAGWWRVSPGGPAGSVLLSPAGLEGLAGDLRAWWTAVLPGSSGGERG